MNLIRRALASALVAIVLAAIAGLFRLDGLPPALAQSDTTDPTVSSVAITSDPDDDDSIYASLYDEDVYGIGDDIEVTVTFSEDVTVTGSPQLELDVGGSAKNAEYDSTDGTEVTFSYTVASGDNDTNGIAISANKLTLNGGSIKDAANNAANLSHNSLPAQSGHTVDGVRPTIMGAPYLVESTYGNGGVHIVGEKISARVAFSEEVIAIGAQPVLVMPRLGFDIGGTTKYADFSPIPVNDWRDATLNFTYTVAKGDLDLDGVAIAANSVGLNGGTVKDAAGNDAVLTHVATAADDDFIVDGVPPTISSIAITSDPGDDDTYGSGDNIEVTVTFSEDVGYRTPTLSLDIGETAKSAALANENAGVMVFRYVVKNGDNDANGISIKANSLSARLIRDTTGNIDIYGNDADLTHDAVADDSGHKVATMGEPPESTDSTLSGLTLSGIVIVPTDDRYYPDIFRPSLVDYTASVANSLTQTTVTPTVNDSGASYVIKLDGVTDADGTMSLAVGSNVITVEVTAEDGQATKTYTVTVTRASAISTDATLRKLNLSGIDIGIGMGVEYISGSHTSYAASVYNSVSQTTVTATPTHSAASYAVKLGGVTDADGVISLSVGSNVIMVEVTAEDGQTTKTYTVTVTRATQSTPTTGELPTDTPRVNFRTTVYTHNFVFLAFGFPRNRGITGYVIQRYEHDGDSFVSAGADGRYERTYDDDSGGGTLYWSQFAEPDTLYKWVVKLLNSQNASVIETSLTVRTPPEPGSTALSSDATLSDLTLSVVDFEVTARAFIAPGFHYDVVSYVGRVANSVTETTVTPTVRHSGASYVIKLGSVTDVDGTVSLAVGSNVITIEVTAEDGETTRTYTVTVTRVSSDASTDATLRRLVLRGVDFGTFASATTSYTTQVASSVAQTTVSAYPSHTGASTVVKLGGVTAAYRRVSLAVGANVITVVVTAEDLATTKTYTVTVTRAAPTSTDATLQALTLRGLFPGLSNFSPNTTYYRVSVVHSSTQATVMPTLTDPNASYVIKIGGVVDEDGVIPINAGRNTITIEVTAADGETTKIYTVLVVRDQAPSTDATLSDLTLSSIDFGTFDSDTTSYSAQVSYRVSQTTVTPTENHYRAHSVIKLNGVEDHNGIVSLAVGSNVITVEVKAEDRKTSLTYTVTVTRAAASTDATLTALTLSGIDFGTFASGTTSYSAQVANSVTQTTVTPTVNHSLASYVIKVGGVTDADGVIVFGVGRNVITVEVTAEDTTTTRTYTVTVTRAAPPSTDATLSALTLSGIDFGTFDSTTASYTTAVANSVAQTTVTPTVNDFGASYVIKLAGVTDSDGVIPLAVGSNVITVEVTAEDGNTSMTYTVTVNRAAPPSTDATLSALTLSGVGFGTFAPGTTSYTAQVDNSVSQTTVTPTVNDSGASYVIKLGGATDADGVIALSVDSNVITVEVTAEDGNTTRTYAVTVTRSAPLSADATLSSLTLSGVNFGTFAPGTTSYTAQVANSISQTTVTPTLNDSGASYVIKLGGATDADGMVALSVGRNVVTVEVTAEDGNTSQTYTVTVTRESPLSTDAKLSALAMSGVDFGTFDSTTVSYTAIVAHGLSQTTVNPTLNHSGATYVVKLNGTVDTDGVVPLSVGSNTITIEVTAQDGIGSLVYTVEVTRAELPTSDTSQRMLDRYDANDNGVIDKEEAISAALDYFDGLITKEEALAAVLLYFFSGT